MKQLWAPWRNQYISSIGESQDCIFCQLVKEKRDKKNFIVFRGKYSFALLNIYPYSNGHVMVAPYRHIADLIDLNKNEFAEMFQILKNLEEKLRKKIKPDGFNIGINIGKAAGAGFAEHIHIHIVPRWYGDTNFMPLFSGARVISQSLKDIYRILKDD